MKKLTIQSAIQEMKTISLKRNNSKGYTQGLNAKEYNRLNSLHSFLISTTEGLEAIYSEGILTK